MIFIVMKKKLIITESQLERLKIILNEENRHALVVKQLKNDLDSNYEPIEKYVRKGGEYFPTAMVKSLTDEEEISVKELYDYMKYRHGIGQETIDETNDTPNNNKPSKEFLKQVIKDWMFGKINDDYSLSKIIPLN
jgi:hypothetical protein